jgi:hypothetical protein
MMWAEALEATRMHRVTSCTGGRTAFVTAYFCVNLRMALRIEHRLIEGACASFHAASSPPAQPSPLCRSAPLLSSTSSPPVTIPRDGAGLGGERAGGHGSCHRTPATIPLTQQCSSRHVAPPGPRRGRFLAWTRQDTGDSRAWPWATTWLSSDVLRPLGLASRHERASLTPAGAQRQE